MSQGYHYELVPRALRDMEHLNPEVRQRIFDALDRLVQDVGHGDVRKLQGRGNEWRLRVGEWRVRFRYNSQARAVVVLRVLHRREAYRS